MGVQHSKKKKEKKWKKFSDKVPPGLTNTDYAQSQLYRAKEIYGRPVSSSPKFYYSPSSESGSTIKSVASSAPSESMLPPIYSTGTRPWSSPLGNFGTDTFFNYNLDNHPDVTKLQNEQNARRENMEQRISKIRTSAIQAAERRKFAEMFKAIPKESSPPAPSLQHRTTRLLQEASAALNAFVTMDTSKSTTTLTTSKVGSGCTGETDDLPLTSRTQSDEDDDDDKGEIIPVQILTTDQRLSKENEGLNFGPLNFTDPYMYLLLPVLLPMFIIVCFIRGLGQQYHPGGGGRMILAPGGPGSSSLSDPSSSSSGNTGSAISTNAIGISDGESLLMSSSYPPTTSLVGNTNYPFTSSADTTTTYSTTAYDYNIHENSIGMPSAIKPKKNKKYN